MSRQGSISLLKSLLVKFPSHTFAFGYGSGVFQQRSDVSNSLLDVIFVVDDVERWHSQNLDCNPTHYSNWTRYLPPPFLARINRAGAGLFFHTDVVVDNNRIKYGVVSQSDLISDCTLWTDFYVAGRLQKPVR